MQRPSVGNVSVSSILTILGFRVPFVQPPQVGFALSTVFNRTVIPHRDPQRKSMHQLPAHEALLMLGTDPMRGLDASEAEQRLARFGPNSLASERRQSPIERFAKQFLQPLIYVLLAAGAAILLTGHTVDAAVIFGVVLANAIMGFIQEARAERALDALASAISTDAAVIRDGKRRQIDSSLVVPGDMLVLEAGSRVPADGRLIDVDELKIDESALTGESLPVAKVEHVLPEETIVADRLNTVFASTLVTNGLGLAVATATGNESELGLVHRLVSSADEIATPLTRKLGHFARILTVAIVVIAGMTVVIGLGRGQQADEVLLAAVALAVGAIPEGLPAAMTITLAIGVKRMARRHAIVRHLVAVETLGSTTVICTDKTGTLTKNEMTAVTVFAAGHDYSVSGVGYGFDGAITSSEEPVADADVNLALRECLVAGVLCNDSRISFSSGRPVAVGDPTEAALVVVAAKDGVDSERLRLGRPRIRATPFSSSRQYMATVHPIGPEGEQMTYVKGAIERIAGMCTAQLGADGKPCSFDARAVMSAARRSAEQGLRVIALARGAGSGGTREPEALTFLGFVAMIDPPRPDAIEAVAACHRAGIDVKMITGDHVGTAQAIAHQFGLGGPVDQSDPPQAVSGLELALMTPDDLQAAASSVSVFARVDPEQKLRLVKALQTRGEVVAMTGDGVNDAPALKQADIGVAMGLGGTEVAKEASDLVLADDNFASIEAAVEEGRRIFDNLTKFIAWTLPTNIGEGLVILTAIALGLTLPIVPVQILWINMTTAVLLGLMLAFEAKEPDVMTRPPRRPGEPILTKRLVLRLTYVSLILVGATFALFEFEQARGNSLAEARTAAVNVFVVAQIFYLLNCRSLERSMLRIGIFSNRWMVAGVVAMIVLQLAFTYVPVMNSLFHSVPIEAEAWIGIVATGIVVWAVVGLEKWVGLRRRSQIKPQQPISEGLGGA